MLMEDPPDLVAINKYVVEPVLRRVRDIEESRPRSNTSTEVPSPGPWRLGPLSQRMLSEPSTYLYDAIRTSRLAGAAIEDILDSIRYLVWRPSTALLAHTLLPEPAGTLYIDKQPVSAAGVAAYFRRQLGRVPDEDWGASLGQVLADAASAVRVQEGSEPGLPVAYRYLRWAITASAPGPQVAPLLALLGKDEAMSRLDTAAALVPSSAHAD
jgi:hypothetical protein